MISNIPQGPTWALTNIITISLDVAFLIIGTNYCRILLWKIRNPLPEISILVKRRNLAVNWFLFAAMLWFGAILIQEILVTIRAIPP